MDLFSRLDSFGRSDLVTIGSTLRDLLIRVSNLSREVSNAEDSLSYREAAASGIDADVGDSSPR